MFWISPLGIGKMKDAFIQIHESRFTNAITNADSRRLRTQIQEDHERRFKKITNADSRRSQRLITQADDTRNHARAQTHTLTRADTYIDSAEIHRGSQI
jgi:hypothetical protein